MIEVHFDVPFVAELAHREKQIQQHYRPVIGVHKWFARRPGTLFRALLLAEFANDTPLRHQFFQGHNLGPRVIGDPFMGGGTPVLEANRLGCHVVGIDVNPMAYWIVRQELGPLDRKAFRAAGKGVAQAVENEIGVLYQTTCSSCGNTSAPVKYFLWVKQQPCMACGGAVDLFPGYLVAKNERHPNYVLVCPACGSLNEVASLGDVEAGVECRVCAAPLAVDGPARRNTFDCPRCGHANSYPRVELGPPVHRLFAIEYHCPACKPAHQGRFFKVPDESDLERVRIAEARSHILPRDFLPDEPIPPGDETDRLHRWGYQTYDQLFSPRQLLGLQTLSAQIACIGDRSVRYALLTVFSDMLRYQNMLCRYDSYALKILDIFSVHGFPVSLIQCENSLLGIPGVGSGGFRHFLVKYDKAKEYCEQPFEKLPGRSSRKVTVPGEQIQASFVSRFPERSDVRSAYLEAISAESVSLPPASLDGVFTDPPYFGNVQYAELIDFCYVWLRKHLKDQVLAFEPASTRVGEELTVNETEGRGIRAFATGLSQVFQVFTQALKPGAPFVFTYHHNDIEAYLPVAVALLDAGLVSTATLPCPAEMGASIHISGTKSSILDTIFVCRTTGTVRRSEFIADQGALKEMLKRDLDKLQQAGLKPTLGDARCLLFGHLVRLAVWQLRAGWQASDPVDTRLKAVESVLQRVYPLDLVDRLAAQTLASLSQIDLLASMRINEEGEPYDLEEEIPF
ncbi:MAG: DUF1156 domain-containing protein [Anaerolineae bacterium]|nr:DUF1156 domain-containing protein [Anaerolineae bacterium]